LWASLISFVSDLFRLETRGDTTRFHNESPWMRKHDSTDSTDYRPIHKWESKNE
jgi:hypothetical protein